MIYRLNRQTLQHPAFSFSHKPLFLLSFLLVCLQASLILFWAKTLVFFLLLLHCRVASHDRYRENFKRLSKLSKIFRSIFYLAFIFYFRVSRLLHVCAHWHVQDGEVGCICSSCVPIAAVAKPFGFWVCHHQLCKFSKFKIGFNS